MNRYDAQYLSGPKYFDAHSSKQAVKVLEAFPLGRMEGFVEAIKDGEPWGAVLDEAVLFVAEGCAVKG